VKQGALVFFMAMAAVAFGIMLKQCDADKQQGTPARKVSSS
jgi:hypothetical protein